MIDEKTLARGANGDNHARKRRSRFLRFSLRTLLIFALLTGAAGLLIRNWAPWALELRLENPQLSPDRSRAATMLERTNGSLDVAVWDVEHGRRLCTVKLAPSGQARFQFSANSRLLAVWIENGPCHLVDLDSGASVRGPRVHQISSFSPDGSRCTVGNKEGDWSVWDTHDAGHLFAIELDRPSLWAGYTPRGHLLVRRSLGDFCMANPETGKCGRWVQNEFLEPVFSSDEKYAAIKQGRGIKLFTVANGEVRGCAACEALAAGRDASFSVDDRFLLARGYEEMLIIDVETMTLTKTLRLKSDEFESDMAKYVNPIGARNAGDFANENFYLDPNRFVSVGFGEFTVKDARTKETLAVFGESDAWKYDSAMPQDIYGALDGSRRVYVYRGRHEFLTYVNRRPERWWGVAWLPEFWGAVVLAACFAWSLGRDWRAKEK